MTTQLAYTSYVTFSEFAAVPAVTFEEFQNEQHVDLFNVWTGIVTAVLESATCAQQAAA